MQKNTFLKLIIKHYHLKLINVFLWKWIYTYLLLIAVCLFIGSMENKCFSGYTI